MEFKVYRTWEWEDATIMKFDSLEELLEFMKASAPEKIWVHELSAKELNVPLKEYHIEYTRTDAFIEKVYNYLKNYAFVDEDKKVHLPTLLHDFIKDSRKF